MPSIIEDPNTDNFDGRYVDNIICALSPQYDYSLLARSMKKYNKSFEQLTEKELSEFLLK